MRVRFVASVSPVVQDAQTARRLYEDALGLDLQSAEGGYRFTERLDGVKHLGVWPLAAAAESCFGSTSWPSDVPVPQASVEFEVDDVPAAAAELEASGYRLLHGPRTEPWGQDVARWLTPEGLLLAVCRTPWLRQPDQEQSRVRRGFWQAVESADAVLRTADLRARWDDPSALNGMTTGELAAHLVRAVTTLVTYLQRPAPEGVPLSPAAYFTTALGDATDTDSEQNRAVRARARGDAGHGADEVLSRWAAACADAGRRLAHEPAERLVSVVAGLVLTLDGYLATRVVELVVHTDDLAVSLGLPEVRPEAAAAEVAEHVLLDVARERHGDRAVLAALARSERADPATLRVL